MQSKSSTASSRPAAARGVYVRMACDASHDFSTGWINGMSIPDHGATMITGEGRGVAKGRRWSEQSQGLIEVGDFYAKDRLRPSTSRQVSRWAQPVGNRDASNVRRCADLPSSPSSPSIGLTSDNPYVDHKSLGVLHFHMSPPPAEAILTSGKKLVCGGKETRDQCCTTPSAPIP